MTEREGKEREPMLQRLARLGLKSEPSARQPSRYRSKRFYREMDEISFNKPNPNKAK